MQGKYIPIVVVYTKGSGFKKYMKVFRNVRLVDQIISARSKKMPDNTTIQHIGWGESFIESYKKTYKIKNHA
jgi:hypothetical protein